MLENYPLFTGNRIKATNNKAIPANDKMAFTSLMTLYACHITLFNTFISIREGKKYTQSQLNEYLKFRPSDDVLEAFECFLVEFWDLMANDWTINGQHSAFWNISRYGLMPAIYIFLGIAVVGLILACWGLLDKKK